MRGNIFVCACLKKQAYMLIALTPEKKTEKMSTINKLFSKSRELGDDKVQLAMQTYEMVCSW